MPGETYHPDASTKRKEAKNAGVKAKRYMPIGDRFRLGDWLGRFVSRATHILHTGIATYSTSVEFRQAIG